MLFLLVKIWTQGNRKWEIFGGHPQTLGAPSPSPNWVRGSKVVSNGRSRWGEQTWKFSRKSLFTVSRNSIVIIFFRSVRSQKRKVSDSRPTDVKSYTPDFTLLVQWLQLCNVSPLQRKRNSKLPWVPVRCTACIAAMELLWLPVKLGLKFMKGLFDHKCCLCECYITLVIWILHSNRCVIYVILLLWKGSHIFPVFRGWNGCPSRCRMS